MEQPQSQAEPQLDTIELEIRSVFFLQLVQWGNCAQNVLFFLVVQKVVERKGVVWSHVY